MAKNSKLTDLKKRADELGVEYAGNIGYDTLSKRVAEAEAGSEPVDDRDPETYEEVKEPDPEAPEEIEEDAATPEPEIEREGVKYCKGLFAWFPASHFTKDDQYSDDYFKSKGITK